MLKKVTGDAPGFRCAQFYERRALEAGGLCPPCLGTGREGVLDG